MPKLPTKTQISSGGVAFRELDVHIEVVLISVGAENRWQLPKGLVDNGESPEEAARREVREEGGVDTTLVQSIEKIEYWYVSKQAGEPTRFHKFVYFFLLRYLSGDPAHHDREVNEARWVEIGQAEDMLTFESEKKVLAKAKELITTG